MDLRTAHDDITDCQQRELGSQDVPNGVDTKLGKHYFNDLSEEDWKWLYAEETYLQTHYRFKDMYSDYVKDVFKLFDQRIRKLPKGVTTKESLFDEYRDRVLGFIADSEAKIDALDYMEQHPQCIEVSDDSTDEDIEPTQHQPEME